MLGGEAGASSELMGSTSRTFLAMKCPQSLFLSSCRVLEVGGGGLRARENISFCLSPSRTSFNAASHLSLGQGFSQIPSAGEPMCSCGSLEPGAPQTLAPLAPFSFTEDNSSSSKAVQKAPHRLLPSWFGSHIPLLVGCMTLGSRVTLTRQVT